MTVLPKAVGQTYNIGGQSEKRISTWSRLFARHWMRRPDDPVVPHQKLIKFVNDRPGHDRRYAIEGGKIESELGWKPRETFERGIRKTIDWYLQNSEWMREVASGEYRKWIATQYP